MNDFNGAYDAKYYGAARLLPPHRRADALALPPAEQCVAEELRLRVGFPVCAVLPDGERALGGTEVTPRELDTVVEIATAASAHSVRETVRAGYINAAGGYRIGLCGETATDSSGVMGFRALSSVAVRIPREVTGIARRAVSAVLATADDARGGIGSVLIISPPGAGKTTLLRDLVRLVSDGAVELGIAPSRVGLADERGEIAAVSGGVPQMNIGCRTDVLSACPKAAAAMMLLRAMNPETLALDEITAPEDVAAVERAANCGVRLFATVHAFSVEELMKKPLYAALLCGGIFEAAVIIKKTGGQRIYEAARL
ncbi:MAG: stage III sporulation protein AB [Oscillospiraceae bacterium]|jgi:stage III sporulation protein AA|nr:stage III sporulation protein AB [Oscillospiraceae bacterium]